MFDITKLALKIPNFLTHEECDRLINEFKQRQEESTLESSKNYKSNKFENSSCKVLSLKPYTHNFNFIKEKTKVAISSYIDYLNQPKYFFTDSLRNALNYSHSYRIMEYKKGTSIHPHSDHDPYTYGSVTFNLNNNYEGGEFKFFNGKYKVPLGKGDVLIFPSTFWIHEVSLVTKGTRYSVNSFIRKIPEPIYNGGNHLARLMTEDYIKNTPQEELLGPYN